MKPSFSLVVALIATRLIGDSGDGGDARPHGVAMGRDARRFAHHGDVEIGDDAAARAHAFASEGEEAVRGSALPLRIARRKVLTDIAVGQRAENGVDQGVERHVGVGMPGDAARIGNTDTAEHDVVAVGESVHVKTVAGAHVGER